jgi:predicted nuclease of predicted toxin-antitoxin system
VSERRVLITNDKDFGELVYRRSLPHAGVVLFRLGNESLDIKERWLAYLLDELTDQLTHFVVVTPIGIRVRTSK